MTIDPSEIRALVLHKLTSLNVRQKIHLPLMDPLSLRSSDDVAKRLVVVYALTGVGSDESVDSLKLWDWLGECGLSESIPKEEALLFKRGNLADSKRAELAWLKEALHTLAWCGGIVNNLGLPDKEADLELLFPKIPPEVNCELFIDEFHLRPAKEIAMELDFHYCLHWVERHRGMFSFGRKFSKDVIVERRRALEWIGNANSSWYDMSLDT